MADIKKAAAAAKPVAKAVAATKPAEAKVEEKKVEAKKAVEEKKAVPAKKAAAPKKTAVKAEAPKAEEKKAAPAKKAPAKKAVVKTSETVFIEFAGGQIEIASIVEKVKESLAGKAVKDLKVYYQPEKSVAYYTADGESGSVNL